MSEEPIAEAFEPAESFGILADEMRVDVLRALWEADSEALSFSVLRDAADIDDSGQFNYHLGKLTEHYVRQSEDGYELTLAGRYVIGALLRGAYTMTGSIESIPFEDPCPYCGGERVFSYEDDGVLVECEDCGVGNSFGVPPGVFAGYDVDAIPDVSGRYLRTQLSQLSAGFCPVCEGQVEPRVATSMATTGDEEDLPEQFRDLPTLRFDCRRCGIELATDLGVGYSEHPAVVAFFYERGIDPRESPLEEFVSAGPDDVRILDRDPVRASVTYRADGATLTLVVDEAGDVAEVRRDP